ncbi:hypothetical protein [Mucilaginibacter sp. L196]|uniref:hypothetical protein n=1 Tax=Mucilaginibacter sp. L196 TaxID=1641870 RepID=UPI001C205F80|nr:hypothetical protein [Mucilaginibacter sp. L196]
MLIPIFSLTAIPFAAFEQMIAGFPTPYEKKMYAEARMGAVLKNYLDTTKDSETKFQRYMKPLAHDFIDHRNVILLFYNQSFII